MMSTIHYGTKIETEWYFYIIIYHYQNKRTLL